MRQEYGSDFEKYANFKFGDAEKTALPFKELPDVENVGHHSGFYATTVEIDERRVLKINRSLHHDFETDTAVPQDNKIAEVVVERSDDPEADRKSVVEKLAVLAKEKKANYEQLRSYFGETIPELELFVIADSPRKEIQKELYGTLSEEVLEKIPTSERALLEVWENVHPEKSLSRLDKGELITLYQDPEFQEQAQKFAQQAKRFLWETGGMLDISFGTSGIAIRDADNTKVRMKNLDDVLSLLDTDADAVPYLRNTTYTDGRLRFFDTYPIDTVGKGISKDDVDTFIAAVEAHDTEKLRSLVKQDKKREKEILTAISYLVTLERVTHPQ